jgi:Vibrio phage DNA polymerase
LAHLARYTVPVAAKSRDVWTYDSETDPFHNCADADCAKCHGGGRVPQPFAHGVYNGRTQQYEEFDSTEGVVDFFARRKALVYAHNGGKFDYHYLRDFINSDEPIMVINGRLARFRIGECEFRDSLNIFPNTRLADFGVKNNIDYALMEPEARTDPNTKCEISRYLRQDCVGLWDVVDRYRSRYGKSLTQATASMKYWEKMSELEAPRQTRTQYEKYKPFYYGGRVQCFEAGVADTAFSVADINSAYPFAMLRDHIFSPHAILERHLPPVPEIYKCLIKLDCTSRGAFPWRDPNTNELFFPDDEGGHRNRMRTYTITGWEFLTALELDAITNIHIRQVHTFPKSINFKDYIEHFYAQRMEAKAKGDKAGTIFGKYFMNSLYGKFGANCANYAEYTLSHPDTPEYKHWIAQGYLRYKKWGERWLLERKPSEAELDDITGKWRFYNVATAASVTGFVRAYLFRALSSCSGLIYCDTDSITARDTRSLAFGSELGHWKDEGRFDRYSIAGKKSYAYHLAGRGDTYDPSEENPSWKIACKGVNLSRECCAPQIISSIALGGTYSCSPQVPTYSVTRVQPVFIARDLRNTYKDMSVAPDVGIEVKKELASLAVRI